MDSKVNTDVVVVGGGPVGLALATELALAGVEVVVLERLAERSGQSKALNLQPRTAEVFDLRELFDSAQSRSMSTVGDGHFSGIPLSYDGWQTRHPYQVGIPQAQTEQVLEERLAELGTKVRRGHELVSFESTEDTVVAKVRDDGGEYEIEAGYLVGCDGGRSRVRKLLGVAFPGTDPTRYAIVADVLLGKIPATMTTTWRSVRDIFGEEDFGRQAVTGTIPLGEPGLFRVLVRLADEERLDRDTQVPDELVIGFLKKAHGDEIEVVEVRSASQFSDTSRQVERYRVGRVLLAGDAAHIHFPAGGQGLNLGVQDAVNLGWKLAADLKGWAPDGLLDTYHAERHPVGERVIENTRAQMTLTGDEPASRAMRKLFREIAEMPEVNRKLAGMISGLDIRYPFDGPSHPLLGARIPDVELRVDGETRWASSLFHSGHGVLLSGDPALLDLALPWRGRVDAVEATGLPEVAAMLVRPDGYVCWVGTGGETGLDAALRTWFGEPEN
ncbi:FAD-dependent oxidoreductase [Amycolatopsis sp. CA-230715]|uniref:FAD-dependent oxidoreductase n=1 Tax=Amycolatopsis sp. CA-230715 TaxID=2745196 RepID=UPI001C038DAF|nr:FAD-dependent oxidoreductase [Amycolatopsis sp. CA-230715]QWF83213.1 Anhydrotetracycline monooxygenase [Amycolatopsis sp. CA-230715]